MPDLSSWALAALLSLPRYADSEDETDRIARLTVIADAVAIAVSEAEAPRPRELAAMVIAAGWFESRFARHVHAGECRTEIGECDHGRARSPWQLHASRAVPVGDWQEMAGADAESTRIAAFYAARLLASARARCGSVEGAFALYATGHACRWSGAKPRAKLAAKLAAAR